MKKVFFLSHLLLLSISFYGSENYFSCDPKKFLSEDMLEKVKLHRESAFNICLSCNGQSCNFKNELISDDKSLSICKRLFCVPSLLAEASKFLPQLLEEKAHLNFNTLYQPRAGSRISI